jgi:hypothetical protein
VLVEAWRWTEITVLGATPGREEVEGGEEGGVGNGFVTQKRGETGGDAGSPAGLGFRGIKGGVVGDTRDAGDEIDGGRVLGTGGDCSSGEGEGTEGGGGGKCVAAFFFLKISSFLALRGRGVGGEEGGEGGGGE